MARQTALSTLLTMFKARMGDSLTVGTASDALFKQLLADEQSWLSVEYDWPFLATRWDVTCNAGDRYKTLPTTDNQGNTAAINMERPVVVEGFWNNRWRVLFAGVGELEEYNYLNSDTNIPGFPQRPLDPIQRWRWSGQTQFEIWPIPTVTQYVRFKGQRALLPLVANSDVADLDDLCIVLFAVSKWLFRNKHPDAQMVLSQAQERLRAVRANYPQRYENYVLGSYDELDPRRIVGMTTNPIIVAHG